MFDLITWISYPYPANYRFTFASYKKQTKKRSVLNKQQTLSELLT